jgi:crotonobetaine/carnitine-CoA ligase
MAAPAFRAHGDAGGLIVRPGWNAASPAAILDLLAATRGDRTFLVDPQLRRHSYEAVQRQVLATAGTLVAHGIERGDRVVVLSQNRIDVFATAFATWRIGAIFVPLNAEQRGSILARWIDDSEPRLIVADEQGRAALASADRAHANKVIDIATIAEGPAAASDPAGYDPERAAMILFSSGTTGVSKGCVLAHGHLVWWGEDFCRAADLVESDVVCSPGPLCHIDAWWAFMASLVNGTPHAFETRFSASRFWPWTAAVGATIFDYVGVIIAILLRHDQDRGDSRLRAGIGGGARPHEIKAFTERFGMPLLECYGLTECCLPIFQREAELRAGTIGRLSEHFEARLVDGEARDVAPGSSGELLLRARGPRYLFSGYWKRPDLTSKALRGGWFHTGDICRVDADGYYTYIDRQGAFIRRRGENISPFEVEGIVLDHPGVANCAVIGVPSELGEEDLLIAIQPKPDASIDPCQLLQWCHGRMAKFMVPRYVRILAQLPMTPSERVERQKLRDEGVPAGTFDAATENARPSRPDVLEAR